MEPGELLTDAGDHTLNPGRRSLTLVVENSGDRPIQVGSHYHFAETNAALRFDRDAARGMGMSPSQVLWQVSLPLAVPVLLSGLRIVTIIHTSQRGHHQRHV